MPGVGYQITTQSIGYGTTNPNSFGDANRKHLVVLNGDQNVTLGAYYQAGVGQYAYMSSGSGTNGAQPLHLQIAGTSRFIIGTDGNCFVNATSLDVGNGIAGEKQIWLRNTNRSTYFYLSNSDSAIGIWDATGSFSRWYSTTTGNFVIAGTLTQNSDERIKTNWRSLAADFIDRLAQVKSGVYDRTDLPDTSVGVSAQDMQALLPQSVLADSRGYLSVAYASTALVAAVELSKRLIALEQRVDQLLAQ